MEDEVSWKKLMGLSQEDDVDEGCVSPVFYKDHWILLPRTDNIYDKRKTISGKPSTSHKTCDPHGKEKCKSEDTDKRNFHNDDNLIYDVTPKKSVCKRRKRLDLQLNGSLTKIKESAYRKSRLIKNSDFNFTKLTPAFNETNAQISNVNGISSSTVSVSSSSTVSCTQSISKVHRKLLYSDECEKKIISQSTLTVSDLEKSILRIEEADRLLPGKQFNQVSNYSSASFKSVSELKVDGPACSKSSYNKLKRRNNLACDVSSGSDDTIVIQKNIFDSTPSYTSSISMNDTFANFQCTEIEEQYNQTKAGTFKNISNQSKTDTLVNCNSYNKVSIKKGGNVFKSSSIDESKFSNDDVIQSRDKENILLLHSETESFKFILQPAFFCFPVTTEIANDSQNKPFICDTATNALKDFEINKNLCDLTNDKKKIKNEDGQSSTLSSDSSYLKCGTETKKTSDKLENSNVIRKCRNDNELNRSSVSPNSRIQELLYANIISNDAFLPSSSGCSTKIIDQSSSGCIKKYNIVVTQHHDAVSDKNNLFEESSTLLSQEEVYSKNEEYQHGVTDLVKSNESLIDVHLGLHSQLSAPKKPNKSDTLPETNLTKLMAYPDEQLMSNVKYKNLDGYNRSPPSKRTNIVNDDSTLGINKRSIYNIVTDEEKQRVSDQFKKSLDKLIPHTNGNRSIGKQPPPGDRNNKCSLIPTRRKKDSVVTTVQRNKTQNNATTFTLAKAKEKYDKQIEPVVIESFEDKNPVLPLKIHGFQFSTAGGKNVNISEDCLRKVQAQFKNDLNGMSFPSSSQEKNHPFYSDIEGCFNISNDRMEKIENNFKGRPQYVQLSTKVDPLSVDILTDRDSGGKIQNPISISMSNLNDIEDVKLSIRPTCESELVGTPELAINKIRHTSIKEDIENLRNTFAIDQMTHSPTLACSERLLSESHRIKNSYAQNGIQNTDFNSALEASFPQFSTAGGCSIKVSVDSLQKIQAEFKDITDEMKLPQKSWIYKGERSTNECTDSKENTNNRASNSNQLENNVLFKSPFLFGGSKENCRNLETHFTDQFSKNLIPMNKPLFQLSNDILKTDIIPVTEKKVVEINTPSPLQLRTLHCSSPDGVQENTNLNLKTGTFEFLTPGGKGSIGVSEDTLRKIRNQYKEELKDDNKLYSVMDELQTVNNTIHTTRERVKETRNIDLLSKEPPFQFSTAGGSTVRVSEESLRKVKYQFRDDFKKDNESLSSPFGPNIQIQSLGNMEVVKSKFKDEIAGKSVDNIGHLEMSPYTSCEKDENKKSNHLISGFNNAQVLTAGVKSSKRSLQKVLTRSEDEFSNGITNSLVRNGLKNKIYRNNMKECFVGQSSSLSPVFSFATAGGQTIEVSEASLKKVKAEFRNELDIKVSINEFHRPHYKEKLPIMDGKLDTKSSEKFEILTQNLCGPLLDEELDRIEKNSKIFCSSDKKIEHVSISPLETNCQNRSMHNVVNNKEIHLPKIQQGQPMQNTQSNLGYTTTLSEMSHSVSAFSNDNRANAKPYVSSPSSFSDRSKFKSLTLWEMDFCDDEILEIVAETVENPNTLEDSQPMSLSDMKFTNVSQSEKRKCDSTLSMEPLEKKPKFSEKWELNEQNMQEMCSARERRLAEFKAMIEDKLRNKSTISLGLYMHKRKDGKLFSFMDSPFNCPKVLSVEELLSRGFKENVLNITSKNAIDFCFHGQDYYTFEECYTLSGLIKLEIDFNLVLSKENTIGLEEISISFLSSENVDPILVPNGWIRNHYRWIIWKLACLEKCFPDQLYKRYLTPENVLHQLKYRYDREIDLAQRPAIKKILECDEPATRSFISCVADIQNIEYNEGEPKCILELTDGWYSIWAQIDDAMTGLIKQGKVNIGTKLVSCGSELLNCADGVDPLEMTSAIRLKINTNSTRRVKWHAKMGFMKYRGPIFVSLNSILPNGGMVGFTTALVARIYPMMYMSKSSDGKTVIRNALAENHVANIFNMERIMKSEELYERIFAEVEAKYKKVHIEKYDKKILKYIKDPRILWSIVSNDPEFSEIQTLLSNDQLSAAKKYNEQISAKIRDEVRSTVSERLQELIPSRNVTNLLKVRLLDPLTEYNAVLTIWRPSEDICTLLTENKCFDFYSLSAAGTRDKVLMLSSTNQTKYKKSSEFKANNNFERKTTDISELVNNSVFPPFGELDIVGVVVHVKEPEKPWGVTNVYLSDVRNKFLMITFWTSLKAFGCEDIVRVGCILAAINLHWRQGSGSYVVPSTFANEMTSFSSNPSQGYLIKEIQQIKEFFSKQVASKFIEEQKEHLMTLIKERESNPQTPKRMVEKGMVRKIERLNAYGPASPLLRVPLASSPGVHRGFKSPRTYPTGPTKNT